MRLVTPDIGTIFWMLLMFTMVLIILRRFAWKPILSALDKRERSIRDSLRAADRARKEMEELKADNEKIMAEARKERDSMLKETRQTSERLINDAKEQAGQEAKRLLEGARLQIENEKAAAMADIRDQVAELSVDIAEKILREKLKDSKEQEALIDRLLKEINLN